MTVETLQEKFFARPLLIPFLMGTLMGVSSVPILGLQAFFFIGLCGFLLYSEISLFFKRPLLSTGLLGFGYFLVALHWIPCSLHISWEHYFYLIPFALLGLPFLFGLYFAVWTWGFPWKNEKGIKKVLFFCFFWVSLEIVRGEFLTGFPWASLGYMWSPVLPVAQLAAWIGPYGLSFLSLLWGTACYVLVSRRYSRRQKKFYGLLALATFLGTVGFGTYRLCSLQEETDPSSSLRLVQPNLPQEFRWTREKMATVLDTFLSLSKESSDRGAHTNSQIKIVLWPEFAMPLAFQVYPWMRDFIKEAVPKGGFLITNGLLYGKTPEEPEEGIYNATLIFDGGGRLLDFYAKHRLLPFGEYIPFRQIIDSLFPGVIHKMSGGMGDFSKGKGPKIIQVPMLPPFLPMVCHEAIFSGAFHGKEVDGAEWILALTNDGWFLNSLGPYQHFEMARMRAIEKGIPLVRVANTGISAVIDPLGRVQVRVPYGVQKVVDFSLPRPLGYKTFYERIVSKDTYFWIMIALGGFIFFHTFIRRTLQGRLKKK